MVWIASDIKMHCKNLLCFFFSGRGGGLPASTGLGPLRAMADLCAGSIKFDGEVEETCRAECDWDCITDDVVWREQLNACGESVGKASSTPVESVVSMPGTLSYCEGSLSRLGPCRERFFWGSAGGELPLLAGDILSNTPSSEIWERGQALLAETFCYCKQGNS